MAKKMHTAPLFKIVLLGDSGVGKTCLQKRFSEGTFSEGYSSTVGVDFNVKTLDVDGEETKLQIWDSAGQERYRSIASSFYRAAHGIIIVYDVSNAHTFTNVERWLRDTEHIDCAKILVGNKSDARHKRVVSTTEGQSLADRLGIPFYETSAKENENVHKIFENTASLTLTRHKKQQKESELLQSDENIKQKLHENNDDGKRRAAKCC